MNAIPFDTLKMARRLESAGFPPPQAADAAEAMADAMSGAELATKDDIQAVRTDIAMVRRDLEGTIAGVRQDLGATIIDTRRDLEGAIADARREAAAAAGNLKREADENKAELRHEIEKTRIELESRIDKLRADFEIMRRDLMLRHGALTFAGVGIILAAMRYMLAHP